MGGLALASLGVRRYKTEEFFDLASLLIPNLQTDLQTSVKLVRSLKSKESHGDMDLLVLNHGSLPDIDTIKNLLTTKYNSKGFHYNGGILSFEYKELQIDLIFTPYHNWECSRVFFAWGDLGNLMGKLYYRFSGLYNYISHIGEMEDIYLRMRYGYDGLKADAYSGHDNTYKLGTIQISKDMEKCFSFLGLDYERSEVGFNVIEEVFDYVIKSEYFHPDPFQWENLNHVNLKRNKRRPNYQKFLDYIENFDTSYKTPVKPNSLEHWKKLGDHFGINLLDELDLLKQKDELQKSIKDKFNGKRLMDLYPELKGKILGQAIERFKTFVFEKHTQMKGTFNDYILYNKIEDIYKDFDEMYKGTE